jgi:hypothetical protein
MVFAGTARHGALPYSRSTAELRWTRRLILHFVRLRFRTRGLRSRDAASTLGRSRRVVCWGTTFSNSLESCRPLRSWTSLLFCFGHRALPQNAVSTYQPARSPYSLRSSPARQRQIPPRPLGLRRAGRNDPCHVGSVHGRHFAGQRVSGENTSDLWPRRRGRIYRDDGFAKVTAVACMWRDMSARKWRFTPRVRATRPRRQSVSACRLAS